MLLEDYLEKALKRTWKRLGKGLKGLGKGFKPRHDYTFSGSPDFEVLKLSHTRTVTAAFHLYNRVA